MNDTSDKVFAMSFEKRIADLQNEKEEIESKFQEIMGGLYNHPDWLFCLHARSEEIRFSAWKRCHDANDGAVFVIKGNSAELFNPGRYWESWTGGGWQEAQNILNDWLSQDFTNK